MPEHIHRQLIATHLRTAIARDISDPELEPYLLPWLGPVGQAAYYRQVAQYDHDFTGHLETLYPRIKAPTLVLWTTHDPTNPVAEGRRIASLIPDAAFVVMDHCRHWPQYEDAETFNSVHIDFLRGRDISRLAR